MKSKAITVDVEGQRFYIDANWNFCQGAVSDHIGGHFWLSLRRTRGEGLYIIANVHHEGLYRLGICPTDCQALIKRYIKPGDRTPKTTRRFVDRVVKLARLEARRLAGRFDELALLPETQALVNRCLHDEGQRFDFTLDRRFIFATEEAELITGHTGSYSTMKHEDVLFWHYWLTFHLPVYGPRQLGPAPQEVL